MGNLTSIALALLVLAGCAGNAAPEISTQSEPTSTNSATPTVQTAVMPPQNVTVNTTASATSESTQAADDSGMPTELNPKATGGLREIIRLAQSGVGDPVILSHIEKTGGTYDLDAEMIVYLHDLGISDEVVLAMMNRGGKSAASTTNATTSPPQTAQTTPAEAVPSVGLPGTVAAGPQAGAVVAQQPTVTTNYTPYPDQLGAPPAPEATPVVMAAPVEEVSTATFQTTLSPYGAWVTVPGYGQCWRPTVAVVDTSWRPYFHGGRWMWTNHGWYWQSDYSWGWAPFHYGRWCRPSGFGWVWTPDTTWGPSWVTWRYTDAHCGWAPLPPAAIYRSGVGFSYYGSNIAVGFGWGLGWNDYSFVGFNRFCDPHPWRHSIRQPRECEAIYQRSTVVNHFEGGGRHGIVNRGLGREDVERLSHAPVREAQVRELPRGQNGPRPDRVQPGGVRDLVYRPAPARATPGVASGFQPAPQPSAASRPVHSGEPPTTFGNRPGPSVDTRPVGVGDAGRPNAAPRPVTVPTAPDRVGSGLVSIPDSSRPSTVAPPAISRPSVSLAPFPSRTPSPSVVTGVRTPPQPVATAVVPPSSSVSATTPAFRPAPATPRQSYYPGQEMSGGTRPQPATQASPVRAPEPTRAATPAPVQSYQPRAAVQNNQPTYTAPAARPSPSYESPRMENRAFTPTPPPTYTPRPTAAPAPTYTPRPMTSPVQAAPVQSYRPAPGQAYGGAAGGQPGPAMRPSPGPSPSQGPTQPGSGNAGREDRRK